MQNRTIFTPYICLVLLFTLVHIGILVTDMWMVIHERKLIFGQQYLYFTNQSNVLLLFNWFWVLHTAFKGHLQYRARLDGKGTSGWFPVIPHRINGLSLLTTCFMTIVGAMYWLLLAKVILPTAKPLHKTISIYLHTVSVAFKYVDYFLGTYRHQFPQQMAKSVLCVPLLWMSVAFPYARFSRNRFYPYWVMDPEIVSRRFTILIMIIVTCLFPSISLLCSTIAGRIERLRLHHFEPLPQPKTGIIPTEGGRTRQRAFFGRRSQAAGRGRRGRIPRSQHVRVVDAWTQTSPQTPEETH